MNTLPNANKIRDVIKDICVSKTKEPFSVIDAKKQLVILVFDIFERETFVSLVDQQIPSEKLKKIIITSYFLSSLSLDEFIDHLIESMQYFQQKAEITVGFQKTEERVQKSVFAMIEQIKWFCLQEIESEDAWGKEQIIDVASLTTMLLIFLEYQE
jgi:hypothetical protein